MTSTDASIGTRFPWVQHDAAAILGDPRPRRFDDLARRGGVWTDLFRDWLQAARPELVAGLDHLIEGPQREADARARLGSVYPAFYRAAGELKDAARRRSRTLAGSFPWAPPNSAGLLGAARPGDLDELIRAGADANWTRVFRDWLAWAQPVPDGVAWLDWIFANAVSGQQWRQVLDGAVGPFAEEIGRLKDALRSASDSGTPQDGAAAAAATPSTGAAAGGWQSARPAGAPPRAAAPAQPVDRRPEQALLLTLNGTTAVSANAHNLTSTVSWLEDDWNRRGGSFADITRSLAGYRELVDQYTDGFDATRSASGDVYSGGDPVAAQDAIRQLRDAVYALAWVIDVAPLAQLGGWPGDHLGYLVTTAAATGSDDLLRVARTGMLSALTDLRTVYSRAVTFLDDARRFVLAVPEGYAGGDSAEPWGTHEVVGADQQLGEWLAAVQAWPELTGSRAEPVDQSVDDAAQQVFGMSAQALSYLR